MPLKGGLISYLTRLMYAPSLPWEILRRPWKSQTQP